MIKYKRTILIILAVLFLVILFFIKKTTIFRNSKTEDVHKQQNGLITDKTTIQDLINKDTDGDSILDWEEILYGTDPKNKETTKGVLDTITINKTKEENGQATTESPKEENLTETNKFSRELFSTIAALTGSGSVDEKTVEELTNALSEKVKNAEQKKTFTFSDIKIKEKENIEDIKTYKKNLINIFTKNKAPDYTPIDILKKFNPGNNTVDPKALIGLNPITENMNDRINAILKMNVPQSISIMHIDFLNGLQGVMENLDNIKLYDSDPLLAFVAISKYKKNSELFYFYSKKLEATIDKKLTN